MDRGIIRLSGIFAICLLYLESVDSFVCYSCSSSTSSLCFKLQEKIECRQWEDKCITMITKTMMQVSKNETIVKYRYSKGCAAGQCKDYCKFYLDQGQLCETECCQGNLCNKHSATTNINRNKRNSLNNSSCLRNNVYLSLACFVSLMYFLLV